MEKIWGREHDHQICRALGLISWTPTSPIRATYFNSAHRVRSGESRNTRPMVETFLGQAQHVQHAQHAQHRPNTGHQPVSRAERIGRHQKSAFNVCATKPFPHTACLRSVWPAKYCISGAILTADTAHDKARAKLCFRTDLMRLRCCTRRGTKTWISSHGHLHYLVLLVIVQILFGGSCDSQYSYLIQVYIILVL